MTAAGQTIQPFWEHIATIFKYPGRTENLIAIVVLSVLGFIANFSIILSILVWMATYKYAYGILSYTARGNLDPPPGYFGEGDDGVAWSQLAMWFVMILAVSFAYASLGNVLGTACAMFVLIALPIATMVLAIDGSLLAALNPATWIDGVGRIGWHYLALLGLLLMFILTSFTVRSLLGGALPWGLGLFAFELVAKYFLVAMFYLLGYVIYQYHDEFGFELDGDALARAEYKQAAQQGHPALNRAEQLVVDGEPEQAKKLLADVLSDEGPLSPVAAQYRKLCQATGDKAALLAISRRQLELVLENEQYDKAVPLLSECQQADPTFKIHNPDRVLPLAKFMNSRGLSREALQLAHGFHKRHPGHRDLIGNLYLAAQILSDKLGRDTDALKILKVIENKFPDHPQLPTVVAYREAVEQIIAGKPS